jgi:hypothetical protein
MLDYITGGDLEGKKETTMFVVCFRVFTAFVLQNYKGLWQSAGYLVPSPVSNKIFIFPFERELLLK